MLSDNGWKDCGFAGETAPDIQPGNFSVITLAIHGNSYIGMVVRDNNTWESVGQKLSIPLLQNNCYDFSINLCRSYTYSSISRLTNLPVSYSESAILRVWGGAMVCDKQELLFETPLVSNLNWNTFDIRLHPQKGDYACIVFEAYYKSSTPYNGNILMDNITPLLTVNCKDAFTKEKYTAIEIEGKSAAIAASQPKVFQLEDLKTDAQKLKKGDIVQLSKLYFDADIAIVKEECEPILNDIYLLLINNPAVSIEIGGHTNNYPNDIQANDLSLKRAKAVANWLYKKGISTNRIQYKGYGKTQPLVSNETLAGREKNQRVEIKIMNIDK